MESTFRHALACAAGACLLSTGAWAQGVTQGVQVGGQIRLTVNSARTGNGSTVHSLTDNASRLSFRGAEDLGDGLAALFGMEFGLGADTGELGAPAMRYSYVGLRGALGSVALGRLDSANPTGSPLYSQVTAITTFAANDAGATAIGTTMLNARNRTSNSIGYRSPVFRDTELMARYYLRGAGSGTETEDDARSLDLGVLYRSKSVVAGIGYAKDTRSGSLKNNEFDDKWQAGIRVDLGAFEPYVLLGVDRYRSTASTRRDVKYWLVGGQFTSGLHSLVLNVMQRDVQASPSGQRRRVQAAWLYALSKRTELQSFVDHDGIDSSKPNVKVRAIGAGLKHVF